MFYSHYPILSSYEDLCQVWYIIKVRIILLLLILILQFLFIWPLNSVLAQVQTQSEVDPNNLAKCLAEKKYVMYGRAGCSACALEKSYFGEAFSQIRYVDCSANEENNRICQSKGIGAYPTWEGAPKGSHPGDIKQYRGAIPLNILAEISGCDSEGPAFYGDNKIIPELAPEQKLAVNYLKEYGGIFLAGILSFFAPCVIPLLPTYLSMISGYTFADLYGLEFFTIRARVFKSALFFVLGFSFVFSLLGASGAIIGQLLNQIMPYLLRLSGLLMIILGLMELQIIKKPSWEFDYAWVSQRRMAKLGFLSSSVTGIASALCWIPCIGPILATILLLAADSNSVVKGMSYLFTYSMGIMFPFLVAALFFPKFFNIYREKRGYLRFFSVAAGLIIIVFGILLLINKYQTFIDWYYSIVKWVPIKL